jgi:hypothetical protein
MAAVQAAPDDFCAVCGDRIGGTVYRFTKLGRDEKVFVCGNCAKLDTACYICTIPVRQKYTRLADGRLLCEEDAKTAVLTQDEAEKIFDDVKRDVQSILARLGSLPHHNIHLHLEAKPRLDKNGSNLISAHDDRLLMGLTRTKRGEQGEFEHSIYLLYGLTRERLAVVAAHEYGHAWLHENVRRKLNQDAVEGFCDWIAYKIISQKNAPFETKVLLDSDYSRGQSQAFIAAEKEHTFYHVMQWVKVGVDPEIDPEHLERVLALREQVTRGNSLAFTADAPPFSFAPAPVRIGPTNFVLKGLSGSKGRRFALINDGTFEQNEQGKVRLGESNVVVRCLEIRDDAVLIQVVGEIERRTLKLGQ